MRRLLYALPLLASTFLVGTATAQTEIILRALDLNNQFDSFTTDTDGTVIPAGVEGAISVPPLLTPGGEPDPALGPLTTATHSFTVNELDVVGDGVADDSIVFSYDVTSDQRKHWACKWHLAFAYGVDGTDDPDDNEIDPGEALTFSNLNAEVTLGDPTGVVPALESANFTFFQARFPGGNDVVLPTGANGETLIPLLEPNGGGNDPYNFAATPQTEFTVTAGDNADPEVIGNGFGVDTISATFVFESETTDVFKGDVNLDGMVTFLDITPFITVLSSGDFQAEADTNCDGFVDFLDITPFIDILAGN